MQDMGSIVVTSQAVELGDTEVEPWVAKQSDHGEVPLKVAIDLQLSQTVQYVLPFHESSPN
jgi:hypothetical protein